MPAGAAEPARHDTQRILRRTSENARNLSRLLMRTADALEESAVLADQHAQRRTLAGFGDDAAEERRVAEQARQAAARARGHAAEYFRRGASRER